MRQFVLPRGWEGGPGCLVEGKEARHLLRVLRLGQGDRFPALGPDGRRYDCLVAAVEGKALRLAVSPAGGEVGEALDRPLPDLRGGRVPSGPDGSGPEAEPRKPLPRIVLAAALLRGERFDLVLRQAAEAGVALVIPLLTARTQGSANGAGRRGRCERVLREALQQSGSPVPTLLGEPTHLAGLPARLGETEGRRLSLLLHEAPLAASTLHRYLAAAPDEIVVCVGPEGGFSPEETDFLRGRGFLPLLLPGAVLRAETAALFAVAAIETIHSERGSWNPGSD